LLSALPLAAHQARPSRTRSDARLYLALLFPRPQRRRLWHLLPQLRRCRPSLSPFRTGKRPSSLGAACPHRQPRLPWVHHPTRAVPVFGGAACVTIRLQHFRICVEADTPTAAESPIHLHWRVVAICGLIRASELELERWILRLLDPRTRTHPQRQPRAQ
jgi:hypothetical protein